MAITTCSLLVAFLVIGLASANVSPLPPVMCPGPVKTTTTTKCPTTITTKCPTTVKTAATTKCPTTVKTTATTKCPPKCGLNEVYSECGNNGCQNTCKNPTIALVCKAMCIPGCICAEGYLRNSKGVCVKPKDCDCTKPNEIFSECDNHPCQNTCENPSLIASCSYIPGCYPGCICQKGYLRNKNGDCVPQRLCYTCGVNETFNDCGSFGCENTCEFPNRLPVCLPAFCEPGCFCLSGFVRNTENGACIREKDCPKKCTGVHEVYSECDNNSCQRTCENYDKFLNNLIACRPICTPGCVCEEGYIRNQNGICVKPEECENRKCTGKNEEYSLCVSPCGETCATMGKNITCNFLVCNPGCDCKKGFFRNSKKECVPPEECDCPDGEELVPCYNPCPPRTCDSIGKMFKCAAPPPCTPACTCKFNYRRNSDGVCIPIQSCPPLECSRPNEVYNPCPAPCLDESCKSLYTGSSCSAISRECFPSCVCRDGYLRNETGECIPKEKCREYCADPNAIFNECGNVCPTTCGNKDKPRICPAICMTSGGCVCKEGFVENYKGVCIKPEECPKCGENEVFACGSACDTTCATLGDACPIVNIKCVEQCYCIGGYARNAEGVCIPIKQCPPKFKCTGKNQVYNACPIQCPPEETCKSYLSGLVVDCATEPETRLCNPRCECQPGFIRKVENGDCINPNQCCDDPNAEVVSCPNPCPGGTCESPDFAPCRAACRIRGCQCKKGYVKDSKGRCILLSQCPNRQCPGQNEEYSDCVPLVQETCATLGKPVCNNGCKPGCRCKPGYVRNCQGKCIKTCDCSVAK